MSKIALAAGAAVSFVVVVPIVALLAVLTVIGGGAAAEIGLCATDANLATVLATIRARESGGDYSADTAAGSASGAYQIIDSTWDHFGGYRRAVEAPPQVQDQKAAELVRHYLQINAELAPSTRRLLNTDTDPVAIVPIMHYWPRTVDAPAWMAMVPMPASGNTLTVGEYQAAWLDEYARQAADPAAGGVGVCTVGWAGWAGGPLLDHIPNCGDLAWGDYRNGELPHSAMRYRPHSGHLHPAASASFDELYAAAQLAGLDLRSGGYRSAEDNSAATRGTSCHGVGLAVDIAVLVPGHPWSTYRDVEEALAGPEFAWLCANAERFGWVVPRWALPAGRRCGSVVGNGVGGCVGEVCGVLESWHLEAVAVAMTHPDFTSNVSHDR